MMVLINNGILDQRSKMKNVTKIGYKTMKIPKDVHDILNQTRKHNVMSWIKCSDRLENFAILDRKKDFLLDDS